MITNIYMAMKNCGDGSVASTLFYDQDVADWYAEFEGITDIEDITIESHGPIGVSWCYTKEEYRKELSSMGDEKALDDFNNEFPKAIPLGAKP